MLAEQLRIHQNFGTAILDAPRNVLVYLPPGYGINPVQRYSVLYMHDAQNLFNPADAFGGVAWGADETAQRLILNGEIEPIIIVGIYNSGDRRIDDYTPVRGTRGRGGQADRYGRMIIEELKPFIDNEYLTRPEREYTGIGGSSLGGLVSIHLGFKRPDVFSRVAALSPSVWWANNQIIRETAILPERIPLRIWLDIGKKEGIRIKHQVRAMKEMLLAQGWEIGADLAYLESPNARHEEAAWKERFDQVLKFLYPVIPGLNA
jgi:predicted alpha/beta superfamily hydrolase